MRATSRILFAFLVPMLLCSNVSANTTIRWDIISVQPPNLREGGEASARTENGLRITITGSGTFRVPDFLAAAPAAQFSASSVPRERPLEPDARYVSPSVFIGKVTGGGNWTLRDPGGATISSGTYRVLLLTRWDPAPGTAPNLTDNIGNPGDVRSGLAIMEIEFSDNTRGTLAVSCHIVGTPDHVFEGIVISKANGFFWNKEAPKAGVDANRTTFHVMK
jgi:hypothetical protein